MNRIRFNRGEFLMVMVSCVVRGAVISAVTYYAAGWFMPDGWAQVSGAVFTGMFSFLWFKGLVASCREKGQNVPLPTLLIDLVGHIALAVTAGTVAGLLGQTIPILVLIGINFITVVAGLGLVTLVLIPMQEEQKQEKIA